MSRSQESRLGPGGSDGAVDGPCGASTPTRESPPLRMSSCSFVDREMEDIKHIGAAPPADKLLGGHASRPESRGTSQSVHQKRGFCVPDRRVDAVMLQFDGALKDLMQPSHHDLPASRQCCVVPTFQKRMRSDESV
jgi:hypothetical protein